MADRLASLEQQLQSAPTSDAAAVADAGPNVRAEPEPESARGGVAAVGRRGGRGRRRRDCFGQIILRLSDDKGKQIGEMKLPANVKGVGVEQPGGKEVKVGGPGERKGPLPANPAEDILPGIVPVRRSCPEWDAGRWSRPAHGGSTKSVAWSPDGKWIAPGGSTDGLVRIFDAKTLQPVRVLLGDSSTVTSVAWRRDSQWLACGGRPDGAAVADGRHAGAGPERACWPGLASGLEPRWRAVGIGAGPDTTRPRALARRWHGGPPAAGHAHGVRCVAWRHDGKGLASGERAVFLWQGSNAVRLWQADGTAGPVLKGHTHIVQSLSWSPDDKPSRPEARMAPSGCGPRMARPRELLEGNKSVRCCLEPGRQIPRGRRLFFGGKLWTATAKGGLALPTRGGVVVARSPGARTVANSPAGSGTAGNIRCWRVEGSPNGEVACNRRADVPGDPASAAVTGSPDGGHALRLLAA